MVKVKDFIQNILLSLADECILETLLWNVKVSPQQNSTKKASCGLLGSEARWEIRPFLSVCLSPPFTSLNTINSIRFGVCFHPYHRSKVVMSNLARKMRSWTLSAYLTISFLTTSYFYFGLKLLSSIHTSSGAWLWKGWSIDFEVIFWHW
jgi:hypothetical protein